MIEFLGCLLEVFGRMHGAWARHEGTDRDPASLPLKLVPWHQLRDSLNQCERARDVVEAQIAVQAVDVDSPRNVRMGEDAFHLRPEEEFAALQIVIKGFD